VVACGVALIVLIVAVARLDGDVRWPAHAAIGCAALLTATAVWTARAAPS
jgi:hypothetical protein